MSGTIGAFNFIRRIGFPPTSDIITVFVTLAGLAVVVSLPISGLSLSATALVAASLIILPSLLGELLCSTIILRGEPVLNFRRLVGMETLAWALIIVFLPLYSLIGVAIGRSTLWIDGLFLTIALSLPIRFLTVYSMSNLGPARKALASVTVPVVALFLFALEIPIILPLGASSKTGLFAIDVQYAVLALLLVVGFWSWTIVRRILSGVNAQGSRVIGDEPMSLFRDFLRHWLKGEGTPLENRLTTLGATGRIAVSTMGFQAADGTRSTVIISNFHPGPYRDLGSGGLPSMLKFGVEATSHSIVLVPHGISNHEYNIISHEDVLKLINEASLNYPATDTFDDGSNMVRESSGNAKATAQIFGDTAFLTLTLAPVDMEDIPSQVGEALEAFAKSKGLNAIVADAHNSLKSQVEITPEQADMLRDAGKRALVRVCDLPRMPFKIGASSDPLTEFKIEEGIGPGGVSALVVETPGQRVAYVVIDGNNMQYGFRQRLLDSIHSLGIVDGEVMTTDTHLVAGVARSTLGYHPVGQGLDQELLISKVRGVVESAASRVNPGMAGFSTFSLDLRVLGSASFQSITSFVGKIARRIGRSFLRLELLAFVSSVVILLVL